MITENQFQQLFNLVTKSVETTQRIEEGQIRLEVTVAHINHDVIKLKEDVGGLKEGQARLEQRQEKIEADVAEIKEGQARLETEFAEVRKELESTNRAFNKLAGNTMRVEARVEMLEESRLN